MPKRVTAYRDWIGGKLSDPRAAAAYLNAARKDSPEAFFKALRRVAESHQMAKVAEVAGVSRESLYRMTMASSNPTHTSFEGILRALGLDYRIVPASLAEATVSQNAPARRFSSGAKILSTAVDATWKLNPSFAGHIEQWSAPAPNTISMLPFEGNSFVAPVLHSANSNPGGIVTIANTQSGLAHAGIEMGLKNARQ
jgi:probable addiction module antidote protein